MEEKKIDNFIEQEDAFDTQKLLEGVDLSNVSEEFELEEILAEYAPRRPKARPAWDDEDTGPLTDDDMRIYNAYHSIIDPQPVKFHQGEKAVHIEDEEETPRMPEKKRTEEPRPTAHPEKKQAPQPAPREAVQEEAPEPPRQEEPEVRAVALEDVMAQVVDSVMEEEETKRQIAQPVVRRGLFSRKRRTVEDTEPLSDLQSPWEDCEQTPFVEEAVEEEEEGPERSGGEATDDYHHRYKKLRGRVRFAKFIAILAVIFAAVEYSGKAATYLTTEYSMIGSLGVILLQCLICFPVFKRGVAELLHGHCKPELLVSLFSLVTIADTAGFWLLSGRSEILPMSAVAAVALYFTMRGEMLRLRGLRDSCHMATYDKNTQPYVVSDIIGGFRKQICDTEGFIRMTDQDSEHTDWYHMLLPVILTATVVFAGLVTFSHYDGAHFLWYWSVILCAACSFAFTAAFGTPIGKLAARLQQDGCAVSGFSGAEKMSHKGSMVLTDQDLFPPGTVFMNGMKVYGHDAIQAVSYASALVSASGCGLKQVFDDLRRNQGGHIYPVEEFSFYEEGGIAGVIAGETVLLGRADFMQQMGVRLPQEINLKTGVFLAIDRELAAVFAIKYMASDNVDAALQAVLHNGIRPVFAVRDFNLTPALIKRKFKINTKKRCLYPELSKRLALSEEEHEGRGKPYALLLREGLMPYAETVIGGKRMHGAICRSVAWTLLGSICGTLLTFYLCFAGDYSVLTPFAMLVFQFLWMVPTVIFNGWVTRY